MERRSDAYSMELFPERGITITCETEEDHSEFHNYKSNNPGWLYSTFDLDNEGEYKFKNGIFYRFADEFVNPCNSMDVEVLSESLPALYLIRQRSRSRHRSAAQVSELNETFLNFGSHNGDEENAENSQVAHRSRSRSRGRGRKGRRDSSFVPCENQEVNRENDEENSDNDQPEDLMAIVVPMSYFGLEYEN